MAKSLDIQLAIKMPDKGLGVEHVASEGGECGGIGDLEAALQVQSTMSTANLWHMQREMVGIEGKSVRMDVDIKKVDVKVDNSMTNGRKVK